MQQQQQQKLIFKTHFNINLSVHLRQGLGNGKLIFFLGLSD